MNIRNTFSLFALGMGMAISALAAQAPPPEVTVDGLHRVHGTKMALVYAKPGVDLSQYNRIYLMKPQIAFTKNWLRTQNSIPNQTITTEDMQHIKSELAELFTSPDTPRTHGTRGAIASVGSMTLYMELLDSVTGDKMVKVMDNKYDRSRTRIQAPNDVRNKAAAKDMLGEWAELVRLALDEARTVVSKH